MRSSLRAVSSASSERLRVLFEQAEASASELSGAEALEALGRAARLEAVIRARYAALAASAAAAPPTPLPAAPRYLDAAAAADHLGISKSTVMRLAKAGTLPARRPSEGVVRFDRADLDAYMARRAL